jgi:excisionase family DNA binding protein
MTLTTKLQSIADQIGHVTLSQVGPFEAAEQVRAKLPSGYAVHVEGHGPSPLGSLRVGQVRVRTADHGRGIYIYRRALTTGDVADLLSVDRRTVTGWCEAGKLEGASQTVGGHWRIAAGSRDLLAMAMDSTP